MASRSDKGVTDALTMAAREKRMSDLIARIQAAYVKRGQPKPTKTAVLRHALEQLTIVLEPQE